MEGIEVKLDLTKQGLAMMFREYEELMIRHMWEDPKPIGSGALWEMVNEKLPDGKSISRASVIFAANRYVENGMWAFEDHTGKGGHHRRYYPLVTEEELWIAVAKAAQDKLNLSADTSVLQLVE